MEAEPWYYNDLERREAEMKCRNTGDYLIRYSSKQNRYILTVNWAGQGRHFIVQQSCNVCGLYVVCVVFAVCAVDACELCAWAASIWLCI